jgi:hypothetical protein
MGRESIHQLEVPMRVDRQQQDLPSGWVKPERKRTLTELQALIKEKKAELQLLESEAFELWHEQRLRAIAQARNIMRAHELTVHDLRM